MYEGIRFCSVPDSLLERGDIAWPDRELSWTITGLPGVSEEEYRTAIQWSLDQWAAVADISPHEVHEARIARILCGTRRMDGPGGVLGETELPFRGAIQVRMWLDGMDAWDITWPPIKLRSIPLRLVVLHELGHAQGLMHAPKDTIAVMSPFLRSQLRGLQSWDIAEIQRRRGSPRTPDSPVPTPSGGKNMGGVLGKFILGIIMKWLERAIADGTLRKILEGLLNRFAGSDAPKTVEQLVEATIEEYNKLH